MSVPVFSLNPEIWPYDPTGLSITNNHPLYESSEPMTLSLLAPSSVELVIMEVVGVSVCHRRLDHCHCLYCCRHLYHCHHMSST